MKLPTWFKNRLKTIMEHNEYPENAFTTEVCDALEKWTPCDLILREYYNNGCASSRGFLHITPNECYRCYEFIKQNQNELRKMGYYSERGCNNSGFLLWLDWKVE